MTIEEEIFRKTKIDFNKLLEYGFKKRRPNIQIFKEYYGQYF